MHGVFLNVCDDVSNHLAAGHDVRDEGDVVHVFDEARDPAEKAKHFDENVAYNKKVFENVTFEIISNVTAEMQLSVTDQSRLAA